MSELFPKLSEKIARWAFNGTFGKNFATVLDLQMWCFGCDLMTFRRFLRPKWLARSNKHEISFSCAQRNFTDMSNSCKARQPALIARHVSRGAARISPFLVCLSWTPGVSYARNLEDVRIPHMNMISKAPNGATTCCTQLDKRFPLIAPPASAMGVPSCRRRGS